MKKSLFMLTALTAILSSSNAYSDSGCCCTDCICPPGPQGPLGSQGSAGSQGLSGPQGIQGVQGLVGPSGSQGIQGKEGIQGPCCNTSVIASVANIYSLLDQSITPGASMLFENSNAITVADYDVSMTSTTGDITILKSGIYSITWGVEGSLTPPFPNPVPSWAFSLYLDAAPVPGSCFSAFTLFPDEATTTTGGTVIVFVTAGQVLSLKSTSTLPVSVASNIFGSVIPQTSSYITIERF